MQVLVDKYYYYYDWAGIECVAISTGLTRIMGG